jgi:hypothetical protein
MNGPSSLEFGLVASSKTPTRFHAMARVHGPRRGAVWRVAAIVTLLHLCTWYSVSCGVPTGPNAAVGDQQGTPYQAAAATAVAAAEGCDLLCVPASLWQTRSLLSSPATLAISDPPVRSNAKGSFMDTPSAQVRRGTGSCCCCWCGKLLLMLCEHARRYLHGTTWLTLSWRVLYGLPRGDGVQLWQPLLCSAHCS